MIDRIAELANRDPAIRRWGRQMNETFMIEVGRTQYLVTVRAGRIESVETEKLVMRSWRFAIRAAVAYGLMSPLSPPAEVWETAWHYMQGGPGVFTGEYDYSASPRDTEAVASRVKGAKLTVMKGLGHFPMSENPQAFLGYLRPVLEEIRSGRTS